MKIVVISPHMQNPYPNIGDSFIALGIANLLKGHDVRWLSLHQRPEERSITEINNSDMVIIGGSNLIGNLQTFYCAWSVKDFAAINVPIVPLALGAQADADHKPILDERGKIILDIIVQKSRAISVRDQLTKEFLEVLYPKSSIHLTGCTAIFLGKVPAATNNKKVVLCPGLVFPYIHIYHNVHYWRMLRKIVAKCNVTQILAQQRETTLFKYILKYPIYWPQENYVEALAKITHAKYLISGRIHAAIAAIQHGVPSIVIATDQRVVSLAKTYGIPCFSWSKTKKSDELLSFLEQALINYDQEKINKNIEASRYKMIDFLGLYNIHATIDCLDDTYPQIPYHLHNHNAKQPSFLVSFIIRCIKKYPYLYKKLRLSNIA